MIDLSHYNEYNIVQVGAGGNGSLITLFLSRLLAGLENNISFNYTIIDGDTVEEKNLLRQHFAYQDLGRNKAQVLAERYGIHFGLSIGYMDTYIENAESLIQVLGRGFNYLPILIGAVDNNKARKIMHQVFDEMYNIAYIDVGCEETFGQAVLGLKIYGVEKLPPVAHYYPDILEDETPAEVGCAEVPIQDISANILSASAVFFFLNNIIGFRTIPTAKVTYNSHNMIMSPTYVYNKETAD